MLSSIKKPLFAGVHWSHRSGRQLASRTGRTGTGLLTHVVSGWVASPLSLAQEPCVFCQYLKLTTLDNLKQSIIGDSDIYIQLIYRHFYFTLFLLIPSTTTPYTHTVYLDSLQQLSAFVNLFSIEVTTLLMSCSMKKFNITISALKVSSFLIGRFFLYF